MPPPKKNRVTTPKKRAQQKVNYSRNSNISNESSTSAGAATSDNLIMTGASTKGDYRKRGRQSKQSEDGPCTSHAFDFDEGEQEPIPLIETTATPTSRGDQRRFSARRIQLKERHARDIEARIKDVITAYIERPWPKKNQASNTRKRRTNEVSRCRGEDCDCSSLAQCHQNAVAYAAAAQYIQKEKPPTIIPPKHKGGKITIHCPNKHNCASTRAKHRIDYYDTGQFGDAVCDHCGALLLKNEALKIKQGRQSPCCADGSSHTEVMKSEFDELQDPPLLLKEGLVEAKDTRLREEFLNNTMPLNNTYAFASVHGEKATGEQVANREDTCKYNGNFSFLLSDLISPQGRRPTFAQVYTLLPEDAVKLRAENISDKLNRAVKQDILQKLEELMRNNPYGQTFTTAGAKIAEAKAQNSDIPHFQIALLTDRDLKDDAIKNRGDCTIIERADAPTAKQVAVIWVQEDGLCPNLSAFWVCDKAGRMRELKSGMPQLDPCCFPLLHPLGTPGWRWFMKKRGRGAPNQISQEEAEMQARLDAAQRDESNNERGIEEPEAPLEIEEQPDEALLDEENGDLDVDNVDEIIEEQGRTDQNDVEDMVESHDSVLEPEITWAPREKHQKMPKKPGPHDNISERQFYRYRMALREDSRGAYHWLWFARRLAEYFIIAVLNRVERNEMDHLKEIQMKKNYRKIMAREYIAAIEKGLQRQGQNRKLGQVFLMPQTFAGSRQYYQNKYADLMTMVRKLGNPTWFVTFTGNPSWPEIASSLQGRQNYVHRADIVCRIFMDKAAEFIKDVTQRHVLGKIAGWCYSVEHQKRGMPHIHMLLILDKQGRITTPTEVDHYVSARIPALPQMDDQSPEAMQQRRLWYYVTGMMLHDCGKACEEKQMVHGEEKVICKKHFPKVFSDCTELSDVRYTNYVRIRPEDANEVLQAGAAVPIVDDNDGRLLPENDPERDWNEVRYQRLPAPGRTNGPPRLYEKCGLTYIKHKKGKNVAVFFDDSRVIPYNSFLLLKYGCHINVEYVFGQKACKYIFKYLLKGFEKAYVQVAQKRRNANHRRGADDPEIYDYDEMAATFKVRYMTSMEAYLRLHSYKIVQMSHQIYTLSVHDELGQTIVLEEGHEEEGNRKLENNTRLTAFFELCRGDSTVRDLTYDRLPYHYYWNQKKHCWTKRVRPMEEDTAGAKMFVRIYTVSPKRQELFAIRCLLLHRPGPTSFEDLRTVDGVVFPTFTEAAQKLGLLESDDIFRRAMEDACAEKSNLKRLQHYFALLIFHSRPSDPQKFFDEFLDEMNPPIVCNDPSYTPKSIEMRRGEVLKNLEYYFNCMGSTCSELGLKGLPNDYNFERQASILEVEDLWDDFFGGDKSRQKSPQQFALNQLKKLNADQKKSFDRISQSLSGNSEQRLFFVEGAGGCGKTFLYNALIRWCLAGKPSPTDEMQGQKENRRESEHDDEQGHQKQPLNSGSVIAAASTGIAALLLIGGGTVHRHFSVPNDVDDDTTPKINYETTRAEQLRSVELIIIDEISMLNSRVLRYVDRLLKDVCACDSPFGGKTIVLGGDWKQLAPVVEHGTREDQVQESIKMEPIFRDNFEKLSLTINMRTEPAQQALREWLHLIGNGLHQQTGAEKQKRWKNRLSIPTQNTAENLDEIVNFCFPSQLFDDPLQNANAIANNAILCPTNKDVQSINDLAMERMQGRAKMFESIDTPLQSQDEFGQFRSDFNLETIHNEMPSGMPPHKLTLKVGAPVMLIRNLDVHQGLCNGTRMQIVKMTDENLYCRILTGPRADVRKEYILPRIKFEYGQGRFHRGLRFRRIQFPVRPCFAMTVNKAQGQTLQRMGLVLNSRQCFSHGQVYVAMSRVMNIDGIRVFSPHTSRGGQCAIDNIVFHELLEDVALPAKPQFANYDLLNNRLDTVEIEEDSEEEQCYFD